MNPSQTLVLANPNSGTAKSEDISELCKKMAFALKVSEHQGHIAEIIQNTDPLKIKNIIVCGGDGTVSEAAKAIMKTSDLRLGIVPCGTGNDLCRTLGIPLDIQQAFNGFKDAKLQQIDVGIMKSASNETLFFNVASSGFSGDIDKHLESEDKKLWGTLVYYKSGLKALSNLEPFKVAVTVNEKVISQCMALNCVVGNGKFAAGGIPIAPEALIDDGRLDLMLYKGDGIWDQLSNLFAISEGSQLEGTQVECLRLSEFTLKFDRPLHANYDGELFPERVNFLQFGIHPKKLSLIVQNNYS